MENIPIVKHELIGRNVTVTACTDPAWIGKAGTILDETKHTFLIQIGDRCKTIAKKTATFEFTDRGKKIRIEGSRLTFRPENRIKKAR